MMPRMWGMMMLGTALGLLLLSPGGHGCCFPAQFEATDGFITGSVADGHAANSLGNLALSVDWNLMKTVTQGDYTTGSDHRQIRILQDYNKKVEYIVENGTCTRAPLHQAPEKCIPENATMQYTFALGPVTQPLKLRQYTYVDGDGNNKVVTVDSSCIPVFSETYGQSENVSFFSTTGLRAVTLGIKDPSVFNIPAPCNDLSSQP